MPMTDETRAEIEAVVGDFRVSPEWKDFLGRWIAFNRAYNELEGDSEEWERVIGIGRRLQHHWNPGIQHLARNLVRLECVGSGRNREGSRLLLAPDPWIKSATVYLRCKLQVHPTAQVGACDFCREEKRALCGPITYKNWSDGEMAALLRIIYQVRCNLVHGDKRLHARNIQTERDQELIQVSICVLNQVLEFLLINEL